MATFEKGILGGFSGKVGTVIGSTWKGIDVMRSKPRKTDRVPSEKQLDQQYKFALMGQFVQIVAGFVQVGFKGYQKGQSAYNSAMGYNLKNAIVGTSPDFEIDFSKTLVSRGDLPPAMNADATSAASGMVKFTWDDNQNVGKAKATDQAMVLIVCPDNLSCIYSTASTSRDNMNATMNASDYAGK